MNKTKKWITYLAAAVLLTVIIPITAGASNSASGNSASGNAPAPTKPNVVQMSTGIKLNSTVPTYFYADTVKGVIVLSPEGMVKKAAGRRKEPEGEPADSAAHSELLSAHEPFQASPNIRNRSGVLVICWKLTMLCIV